MSLKEEKFVFKYNGDLEYIDFETLYTSQLHFTEFIRELKDSLYPDGELKIKVKALPKGSFPIELLLDVDVAKNVALWAFAGAGAVGTIVATINSVFELFKNLKGRKPDKEVEKDDITIIYIDNRTFQISTSVYQAVKNNPKIRQELSLSFNRIKNDDEIVGVELLDDKKESMIEIDKEEFMFFDKKQTEVILEEDIPEDRTIEKSDQKMSIFKVVFSKGFKWQFIYKGNKISANIEDDKFLLDVTKGKVSFSNGDAIDCDIRIKQSYNEIAHTFQNNSYTITAIHNIIPRNKQIDLFSDN